MSLADFPEQEQRINLGFAVLTVPSDADPQEAVKQFMATEEFDRMLDKDTGTSAFVRGQVGTARGEDRLANIRRFYPDAIPYGDDNFVFVNPDTGKPTLYNPPGFEAADLASVGREITQAAFSGLGAAGGAIVGTAAGAPTGPGAIGTGVAGAAVGAGIGDVTGGTLWDIAAQRIGGQINTRTALEAALDTLVEFGGGAVGQRGGELVEAGVRRALGGGTQATRRLMERYIRAGIEPTAGGVTGSRTVGITEQSLRTMPASAGAMQRQAQAVIDQTRSAVDDLAEQFGTVQSIDTAGDFIRQAARRGAERFGLRQGELYDEVFDLIGADTLVDVATVRALRQELLGELATAPRALGEPLAPVIKLLTDIESDAAANGGQLTFEALRAIRTNIGRDIGKPTMFVTSSQSVNLARAYAALTEDLSAAAATTSDDVARRLTTVDRFTRLFRNTAGETLEKIVDLNADRNAFNYVMSRSRDGATMLRRLRNNFTDDEWDVVAATTLHRLGLANPGVQTATGDAFSVATFLTNYNRMTPAAREALFGGGRYEDLAPALDDLVSIVGSLKEVERLTNTSNTAQVMAGHMMVTTLGGGLGGLVSGDATGVAGGVASTIIAPRVSAALITSPRFVRWLATPITSPNGIGPHIGRLVAIAEAEPELKAEIQAYVDTLRENLSNDDN